MGNIYNSRGKHGTEPFKESGKLPLVCRTNTVALVEQYGKKNSLFGKYLLKCFIYVHMSVCVYVICERGECGGQKRHWIPGAGITGSCELFDVSAKNRI